ncbi:hypothetical protein CYK37_24725 [Mesorhizobium loti]|nr:hypothetical protein CYK37_24725 [Mesorhizobium loti]
MANWSIARPPRLANSRAKGQYRIEPGALPAGGTSIARADLATVLLDVIESGTYRSSIVGISR